MGCEKEEGILKQFNKNNYFYGKLMTVKDFNAEQCYFNGKRHLINRLILGIGIVCGLSVEDNTNTEKQPNKGSDGLWNIYLNPGVAFDCYGQEIVVSNGSKYEVTGTFGSDTNGLYLKYDECQKDIVPKLANSSKCEEECCPNMNGETFSLEWGSLPEIPIIQPRKETEITEENIENRVFPVEELKKMIAQEYYENNLKVCRDCGEAKVLLAVFNGTTEPETINQDKTYQYRSIVYDNPMLYDLLTSHTTRFDNPHNVTATQLGALVSINTIKGDATGNLTLLGSESITVNPSKDKPNTIVIDSNADVDQNKIKLLSDFVFEDTLKKTATTFKAIWAVLNRLEAVNSANRVNNLYSFTLSKIQIPEFIDENQFRAAIFGQCRSIESIKPSRIIPGKIKPDLIKILKSEDIQLSTEANISKLGLNGDQYLIEEELKDKKVNAARGKKAEIFSRVTTVGYLDVTEKIKPVFCSTGIYLLENIILKALQSQGISITGLEDFQLALKQLGDMKNRDIIEIAMAQEEVCFYASLMEFTNKIN